MTGLLNIAALEKALGEIVKRHEILRTTFGSVDGRAVQRISPELTLPVPFDKLGDTADEEKASKVQRLIDEEAKRPFDLAAGPLLRARLLQLNKREYVLLLTMHHIISDGWSLGVFMREMCQLYVAYVNGRPSPLAPLPIQYADYAVWQREWASGEMSENHLAYWRRQLAGVPVVFELPSDRPRPPVQSHGGANLRFALSEELSQELNALGRREGATLYMVLFAAFATLLHLYTEQEDFLIGTPVANRNRSEIESLIGFFVNTLVMRVSPEPDMSFQDLLGQVREVTLGAYAHQDVPFEKLVDEFHPERDMSRSPLFQILFALQNISMTNVDLPGLKLKPEAVDNGASKFDLSLYIEEGARSLTGTWEYSTELFDEATISCMAASFTRLLEDIVSDPRRRLRNLHLLGETDERRLLVEWNDTSADFPSELCLHQLFEQQAARTPDHIAVVFEEEQVTYGELDRRADELAFRLRSLGVGPEERVVLLLERSIEMMVALLGVLKAGGAYVPLDPEFPAERLRFMLEDSGARVVLTQRRLADMVPAHCAAQVLYMEEERGNVKSSQLAGAVEAGGAGLEASPQRVRPENLAYVIYTSGSTGRPKGVAIPHRAIVNFISTMRRRPGLTAADRVGAVTTLSFDISLLELLLPLSVGATVEVLSRELAADGVRLAKRLRTSGITVVQATPATWRLLLAAGWSSPLKALCGGERLPEDVAQELAMRADEVWNMYGPTETTVWSSVAEVKGGGARVHLGRPIANTQFYVLGALMRPVPVGAFGELYIGGEGVARGYLNRADLTAERFVPDPFGGQPGMRLYRTGDVVRYLRGGEVEYVGRADFQVKVRGFRIELGEIEAALREHEAIREVCVVAREDTSGDKRLVAYLVTGGGDAPNVSELRAFLRAKMPEYMLPSFFVTMEALPLTPNGKVDRKGLPDPGHERPNLERGFAQPHTAVEVSLAKIWSEVLGIEEVGVHDNFFELGGDSILSVQIVAKAASAGLSFTPRELFQHQTVATLAAAVDSTIAVEAAQDAAGGSIMLTPAQHRFFEDADPHHFNQFVMLEVQRKLDTRLLRRAFEQLHLRHDALRLRFQHGTAGWQQFIDPPGAWDGFTQIDLSGLRPTAQAGVMAEIAAMLTRRLDLSMGKPFRAVLINLGGAQGWRLILVAHGQVVDSASWQILLDDLERTYALPNPGERPPGPNISSFRKWAGKLKEYAESGELKPDYWLDALSSGTSGLPRDNGGENTAASAQSVSVELEAEETRALLGEVPDAYRTQVDEVLLTSLSRAFKEWTGSAVLIDVEGRGRENLSLGLNVANTTGQLAFFYPVLLEVNDDGTPGDALKRVKEQLRRVPHHGSGYGLMRYMGTEETAAKLRALPQAEVRFNYRGQFGGETAETTDARMFNWIDAPVWPVERSHQNPRYLIEIDAYIFNERLHVRWTYSQAMHERSTIERLANSFIEMLRELIAHCQSDEIQGVTTADFPFARLDENNLGKLAALISSEDESDLFTA